MEVKCPDRATMCRERGAQWELMNEMEAVLRRSQPGLGDGTDFVRQWRYRDEPMLNAVLDYEQAHAADGTGEWWLAVLRVAKRAQTKSYPLRESRCHRLRCVLG